MAFGQEVLAGSGDIANELEWRGRTCWRCFVKVDGAFAYVEEIERSEDGIEDGLE